MALADQLAGNGPAPVAAPAEVKSVPKSAEIAHTRQAERADFRARQAEKLRLEREPAVEPVLTEVVDDLVDPDVNARETEEPNLLLETEEVESDLQVGDEEAMTPAEEATDGIDDDQSAELPEGTTEVTQLQARVEELEDERTNFERGFRQKTHDLSARHRTIETQMNDNEATANFFMNIANQGVNAFEGVDWNQLRTHPEEYQRQAQNYQTAVTNRDRLLATVKQVQERNAATREEVRLQEARTSVDMLAIALPKWDESTFVGLRDFAVNDTGLFTAEEFSKCNDWRIMKLLSIAQGVAKAPKSVSGLKVKGGKKLPRGQVQKIVTKSRNAKGQFEKSRQELHNSPGDRAATRTFFENKLRAERQA